MCGRYSFFTEEENHEIIRIVRSLDTRYPDNNMKHGEIFPLIRLPFCALDRMK